MLEREFNTNKYFFNADNVELIDQDEYTAKLFPVVYILFDESRMLAYVGETTNAKSRLSTHLSHKEKKKLKRLYVISSASFNKSAVLDIESLLIQSMPVLGFNLLNGNGGIANHNYYQKEVYLKLFQKLQHQG